MRSAQRRIGLGIIGVEINGALKKLACLVVVVACRMREGIPAAQHILISREAAGRFCQRTLPLKASQLYRRCTNDTLSDIVLHRKDVADLGIVGFAPEMPPGCGLGQLDTDANTIPGTADAAFEQVARIE
jgi:hypothetical protein